MAGETKIQIDLLSYGTQVLIGDKQEESGYPGEAILMGNGQILSTGIDRRQRLTAVAIARRLRSGSLTITNERNRLTDAELRLLREHRMNEALRIVSEKAD